MMTLDDRMQEYLVQAMVAIDSVEKLGERVNRMLEGRTLVKTFRYLTADGTLEIKTGLTVQSFRFAGAREAWWGLAPGIEGFGFNVPFDHGGREEFETEVWKRYHSKDHKRTDMTMLEIHGRSFDDRSAKIVRREWNQFGVGMETVLVAQR